MKKAMLTAMLLLTMSTTVTPGQVATLPAHAAAAEDGGDIRITLYGEPFSAERSPILVDGVTLVPLRDIAEALGAAVSWDNGAQSVKLHKSASEIRLAIGSTEAVKNGQPIRLEAAPRLMGNVTMVPLRFIGESFDALVTWNGDTRTASIDHLQSLPTIGSYENLKAMLEKTRQPLYGVAIEAGSVAGSAAFVDVQLNAKVKEQAG
ncbi:MAG: hypothetical protein K0R28_3263, partial [Paenibacillus sp.]|nr:hypothetical protein [Paenibacillus sp.]